MLGININIVNNICGHVYLSALSRSTYQVRQWTAEVCATVSYMGLGYVGEIDEMICSQEGDRDHLRTCQTVDEQN